MSKSKAVIAILLILICTGLAACGKDQHSAELFHQPALSAPQQANYKTKIIEPSEYIKSTNADARLYYPVLTNLVWEEDNARFDEILVGLGDYVEEGDVLMTFEIEESDAQLTQLELEYSRLEANFARELESRNHEIAKEEEKLSALNTSDDVKIQWLQLEKKKVQLEQFIYQQEKELGKVQENIELLKEKRETTALIAPHAGVVGSLNYLATGSKVPVGSTLVSLYSDKCLVYGDSDEMRYNMEVTVNMKRGWEGEAFTYTGRVVSSPDILPRDISSNYYYVQLNENLSSFAYVRQPRNITCVGDSEVLKDVICVDKNMIHREGVNSFVYLLEGDSLQKRYVTEGFSGSNSVCILDGLSFGQTIVLD